eukprot:jgi/Botrbrau1/13154/Bobra.0187s0102.1
MAWPKMDEAMRSTYISMMQGVSSAIAPIFEDMMAPVVRDVTDYFLPYIAELARCPKYCPEARPRTATKSRMATTTGDGPSGKGPCSSPTQLLSSSPELPGVAARALGATGKEARKKRFWKGEEGIARSALLAPFPPAPT